MAETADIKPKSIASRSKSMIVPGTGSHGNSPSVVVSVSDSTKRVLGSSAEGIVVPKPSKPPSAPKDKDSNAAHIRVAVRCRPLNEEEKKGNQSSVVSCDLETNTVKVMYGTATKKLSRTLEFDKVFGMYSRQQEVYETMVKPIVEEAMNGYNCTVFAYGPTGTGKTHTMSGELNDDELWGMVPRAAKTIFEHTGTHIDRTIKVSYLEICK